MFLLLASAEADQKASGQPWIHLASTKPNFYLGPSTGFDSTEAAHTFSWALLAGTRTALAAQLLFEVLLHELYQYIHMHKCMHILCIFILMCVSP